MDLEEIPETPTEENVTKDRTNSRIEKKKKRKAEGEAEEGSGDETGQKPGKLEKQLTFVLASLSDENASNVARRNSRLQRPMSTYQQQEIQEENDEPEEEANVKKLFIQMGKDVKKVAFKAHPPIIPALKELFATKFKFKLKGEFPPIYIKDPDSEVFYEFEKPYSIEEKSIIKLQFEDDSDDPRFDQALSSKPTNISKLLKEMESLKDAVLGSKSSKANAEFEKALAQITAKQEELNQKRKKFIQDKTEVQRSALVGLKKELMAIKQLYVTSTLEQLKTIQEVEKILKTRESLLSSQVTQADQVDQGRASLNQEKALIQNVTSTFPTRIHELKELLEETKKDILKRKCKPSPATISFIEQNANELQTSLDQVLDLFQKEKKQQWKKTWERELSTVLQEQTFFKEEEKRCEDFDDELTELLEGLEDIETIVEELKKTNSMKKEFVVPLPMDESEFSKDGLLVEIRSQEISSERRLKAMEAAEKSRQIEKAMKPENDFEQELKGFVGQKKFKKTGGFEEIEKERQRRDRENLIASAGATD